MDIPKEKYTHYFEYILEIIIQADAYKQYVEQLFYTNENRIEIINDSASTFFVMCKQAFIEAIIMRISKITDPASTGKFKNLTLKTLFQEVVPTDSMEHNEIENQLHALDQQLEKLRKLRNKQLGHIDLNSIGVEFSITFNDIKVALTLLGKIYNTLRKFINPDQHFSTQVILPIKADARAALIMLERGRRYKKLIDDLSEECLLPFIPIDE